MLLSFGALVIFHLSPQEPAMNQILGKVVLRESQTGVGGLLVTLYDGAGINAEAHGESDAQYAAESHWQRLGSVITAENGGFQLDYTAGKTRTDARAKRDIILVLSAPTEDCAPERERSARIATCHRQDAAPVESFLIAVDEARLQQAGIRAHDAEPDAETARATHTRKAGERRARYDANARTAYARMLEAGREAQRAATARFNPFISVLSSLSEDRRTVASSRYVPPGASVLSANETVIRDSIARRVTPSTMSGAVQLSDEELAGFRRPDGRLPDEIAGADIESRLWPAGSRKAPTRLRIPPLSLLCRDEREDECMQILQDGLDAEGTHDHDHDEDHPPADTTVVVDTTAHPIGNGADVAAAFTIADVPLLIGELTQDVTSPESAVVFGLHKTAGLEEVQRGVDGFTLRSGPADAPAVHDFHHLKIAFEHVWQELFDETITDTGKKLYAKLVELGVDPNEYLIDASENKFKLEIDNFTFAQAAVVEEAPSKVIKEFDITAEQWTVLARIDRDTELGDIADAIQTLKTNRDTEIGNFNTLIRSLPSGWVPPHVIDAAKQAIQMRYEAPLREEHRRGQRIIDYANHKLEEPHEFEQFHKLLDDLAKAVKQPHRFTVYAANRFHRSVNFGIVATYRQKWAPTTYQVGELVKTIPLAPKEVRRFTKKTSIRQSRADKEVQNHMESRRNERSETARAETEIIQKAANKTNFKMSAEGGVSIGIANASGSTGFSQDAATESQEVKKEFREAVFKAAEEYKSERMVEVTVNTSEEFSAEESGEISNPNDEIPVTYLFYELQRRYQVSEQIHRLTPIVLVAQEFPKPSDIDDDWIVAHDWILRRVILDDSFVPAMNYLATKIVGDEFSLQEMYENLQQHRRLSAELQEELVAVRAQVQSRYGAFQRSIEQRADVVQADDEGGIMPMPVGFLSTGADVSPEAARVREDAARDAFERTAKQEKELLGRLEREITALDALTETYTKALSDHLNRKAQIARLRVHIKSNVMYYMQAIWTHEPSDQRYFRLHEVRVPKLKGNTTYKLVADPDAVPVPPNWKKPLKLEVKCDLDPNLEFETLEEVADLDNLLGFKGNYMMFPLKKGNVLTDYMSMPYIDSYAGLSDPDQLGNWTLHDFAEYVCCMHRRLSRERFLERLPGLQEAYRRILNAARNDGEEIIVPTNSLYIEALPGVHPILEDFKLVHRAVDVKKVQAEVRGIEFENIRAAARLLAGEHEDPTIEKMIRVEGVPNVLIPADS
jgi:hypothetical protein